MSRFYLGRSSKHTSVQPPPPSREKKPAKRLATIDVLSRGRMRLLTVGLGSLPREAQAMGVDFATRGRRAEEAIRVIRALWAGGDEGADHDGEFFSFEAVCSFPKPLSATLPVHIGGSSRAAARRAGRLGDGFFPGGALDAQERAAQWELARASTAEAGRDPDSLEYTRFGSLDMPVERVEELAEQGVTRVVVSAGATEPDD
ncbi:hypothetical protein C1I98_33970 [Spongiactinospora gelatinilytica]|uniref:Luciferase-like domain-containing protein n=1 Tax=Spongiactinospora gelatinilytica TaxID=2666298 RepID=A0A2W2F9Z0_9ACTN|nr:LLM class flavin-dependent oxidoreductase [Spongiactinospora gelatinilytica]PZG26359.1 hypothetical protein C1I98_33970 [Spongiactinospora gelatinilytica]